MTFYVLASVRPPVVTPVRTPDVVMWLESLDGSQRVDLSSGPVRWRANATGLGVPPVEVLMGTSPGMAGATVEDVYTTERDVLLPVTIGGRNWVETWGAIQRLRDITDPTNGVGPEGNFRLVAASPNGVRHLDLTYRGGLEDDGQPSQVRQNRVLDLVAAMPFAQEPEEETAEFRLVSTPRPFLSGSPGTSRPWGTLAITASEVLSGETPVNLLSAVPVFPTIEIVGPGESVLLVGDNGLRIEVPLGLGSDETMRIVTDPRRPSVRVNGLLAAGRVALGSRSAPFGKGTTKITATIPDATSATRLRMTWRGLHRGLW